VAVVWLTASFSTAQEKRPTEYHIGTTSQGPSWRVEVGTIFVLEARELTSAQAHLIGGQRLSLTDPAAHFWVVPVKVTNRRKDVPTAPFNRAWFMLNTTTTDNKTTTLASAGTKDYPGYTTTTDLSTNATQNVELLYVVIGIPKDMTLEFVDVRVPLLQAGLPVSITRTPTQATAFSRSVQEVQTALASARPGWVPKELITRSRDARNTEAVAVVMSESTWEIRLRAIELLQEIGDDNAVRLLVATLRDPEFLVRGAAADALGTLRNRAATQPLIDVLRAGEYLVVLKSTAAALGAIGDPKALDALRRLIIETTDTETQDVARRAITRINTKR
jgi:hypothetical protein